MKSKEWVERKIKDIGCEIIHYTQTAEDIQQNMNKLIVLSSQKSILIEILEEQ